MEIITKQVIRKELVEKFSKGKVVLDENEMPVMEEKEVVEDKEFVREYVDIAKEEKIAELERYIADDVAEIARRTEHKEKLEAKLLELTK
jgi:hypothetical protein